MNADTNEELIKVKQETATSLKKDADYATEKFDTLIVSLSSGALVFSVGFIKDVIKDFHKVDLFWLKFCWGCFALSLIGNLMSQVTGYYSNHYERKAVKNQIKELKGHKSIKEVDIQKVITTLQSKSDVFNDFTLVLNTVCLFAFIFGVCTSIYFIYSNV